MRVSADWSYPTAIRFGAGRIAEIAEACAQAGIRRPLVVTDRGLKDLPITRDLVQRLDAAGLGRAVFADVDPDPHEGNLAEARRVYRGGGFDGVVAFGGGSALDLGKLVAFMARQSRPVWDFADIGDQWRRAEPGGIDPVVAVPTTAGTGSEVGRAGVLRDAEAGTKTIVFHPAMLPRVAICDPELTVGMPRAITAGTGLDAFAHCLEAFCAPHYHPMSRGIALEGMRLVRDNLIRAYADPGDLEARGNMMSAALMGATAFQKGLGAIHALSHPIGARHHTHHGTTNAVVMPAVLRFNAAAVAAELGRAAAYMGIAGGFDGFCADVEARSDALGIPRSLAGLGVRDADPEALARAALADPSAAGNPVPMTLANTRALIEACL